MAVFSEKSFWPGLVALLFLLSNCSKIDVPEPAAGTPVFQAEVLLDGVPLSLKAGIDDYYMFTETDRDQEGAYLLRGVLAGSRCRECGPSLGIEIRSRIEKGDPVFSPEMALSPGAVAFQPPLMAIQQSYIRSTLQAQPLSSHPIRQYRWTFSDGSTSDATGLVRDFPLNTGPTATLRVENAAGLVSEQSAVLFPQSGSGCRVDIINFGQTDSLIILGAITPANSPGTQFFWSTGEREPRIRVRPQGTYCVKTLADSCSSERCLTFASTQGGTAFCAANFVVQNTRIDSTVYVASATGTTVVVTYTDARGVIYRSDLQPQPAGSAFDIVSSEPYKNNENGTPTRRIGLRFRCRLTAPGGQSIELSGGTAVFAVGHP